MNSFGFSGICVCTVVGDDWGAVMRRPCGVEASDFTGLLSLLEELSSNLLECSLSEPGERERPECWEFGLCRRSWGGVHGGFGNP